VTIAAAFSTGSAINATLFATARLAHIVARDGELPAALDHKNAAGIPDRAVLALGAGAAALAVIGALTALVEAASLAFLFTFTVVCGLAFRRRAGLRIATGAGCLAAAAATATLIVRLSLTEPYVLLSLAVLVLAAVIGRPIILSHLRTERRP
jgi:amino acid transporter